MLYFYRPGNRPETYFWPEMEKHRSYTLEVLLASMEINLLKEDFQQLYQKPKNKQETSKMSPENSIKQTFSNVTSNKTNSMHIIPGLQDKSSF